MYDTTGEDRDSLLFFVIVELVVGRLPPWTIRQGFVVFDDSGCSFYSECMV